MVRTLQTIYHLFQVPIHSSLFLLCNLKNQYVAHFLSFSFRRPQTVYFVQFLDQPVNGALLNFGCIQESSNKGVFSRPSGEYIHYAKNIVS